jgi:hypothetical protein
MQPGNERAVAAKRVEPAPRFYEDILQQLRCVGFVARLEAEAERVNAWRMLAIEELERIDIASLRASNLLERSGFVFSVR